METQMPHHHGLTGEDTHNTALYAAGMEGEDHEKKSVIEKVKAKAKKIKDKLTPHAHGGHDHHDQHTGHEVEEEDNDDDDDEDEEMVQDPEIHVYESAAIRGGVAGPGANTGQPAGANYLERPSVKAEEVERHHDSHIYDPPVRTFGQWQEENPGLGKPLETHEPHVSLNPNVTAPASDFMSHGRDVNADQSRDRIGELPAIAEDPHAPKRQPGATAPSNYESKVTGPTGGGGNEAGITSILHSMDKMGIYDDKPKPGEETKMYTGSHDQFAPDEVPKSFNPDKPEELPRDALTGHQNPSNQSSYRDQISSATSAIAGKAVAAKDAIATKLGYTAAESNPVNAKSASPTEYASKIAATVTEKLTPVYEKAVDVGNTVMSKVQGAGAGTEQQQVEKGPDKGVSVTTYLTERLKPGDEDKALSEVITHAFKRGNEEKGTEGEVKSSVQGKPISEVVSDAVHKRGGEEEVAGEGRQLGKVTESEEVKRQLGSRKEHEHSGGSGGGSNLGMQKGMVDRLKGAVSSWMGKGGDSQSTGTTYVTDQGLSSSGSGQDAGERKLQESTY